MKRFSTAAVATATALSLAAGPAFAEENQPTANDSVAATADQPANDATAGGDATATDTAATDSKPVDSKPVDSDAADTKPATKGSATGPLVGVITGLIAATATIAIIVGSNPSGINKIVDILNAQFGLGLAHVPLPF